MKTLPASPDLDHLKKPAKQLVRDARAGLEPALRRFVENLPAARGIPLAVLAERPLALHNAQSVVAREYGFRSWIELGRFVEWKRAETGVRLKTWLTWVFEGTRRQRALAIRLLGDEPGLFCADAAVACAIGDEARVSASLARDPAWANRAPSASAIPPLAIVTHSQLIGEPAFEPGLLACARLLLRHGADVNGTWVDPRFPDSPLSALYGAAGRTHHVAMAELLLDAGADPNDGESLYHSVESRTSDCTRLLLDAGARVVGSNAIAHVLDYDKLADLRMLLERGGDPRERPWVHHAILRGRSTAHVRVLLEAGADPHAVHQGVSLFRYAQMQGRDDVVALLRERGADEPLSREETFVAACARGDEAAAHRMMRETPDIVGSLTPEQLGTLPVCAGLGRYRAVRTMLSMGWPLEVKSGWGNGLNLAVSAGDAEMARILLDGGSDWRWQHDFGNNVLGTLSAGSQYEGDGATGPRDFVGCARALVAHGVPLAAMEPYTFSAEVGEYLDRVRLGSE